jgi:hypothetical protein
MASNKNPCIAAVTTEKAMMARMTQSAAFSEETFTRGSVGR